MKLIPLRLSVDMKKVPLFLDLKWLIVNGTPYINGVGSLNGVHVFVFMGVPTPFVSTVFTMNSWILKS